MNYLNTFLLFCSLISFNFSFGQYSSMPQGMSQSMPQTTPSPMPQQPVFPSNVETQPAPQIRLGQTPQTLNYFHPGILVFRNGQWQGKDDLLNLSNQIGVYVDILKSPVDNLAISKDVFQKKISEMFQKAGLYPRTMGNIDRPPLPAFQMKIFIYPVQGGHAAFCAAKLFEAVILNRFDLERGMYYQAITWERESLIVDSTDRILMQIDKQVQELTQAFISIYHTYLRQKQQVVQYQ